MMLLWLSSLGAIPNPLNELEYIDLLIESEKQQCKPGYKKRLEYLQEARKFAKLIQQINQGEDCRDAPPWLKDVAEKAKENMKKHKRSFQNPKYARMQPTPPYAHGQPPPPPPAYAKQYQSKGSKWGWPFK